MTNQQLLKDGRTHFVEAITKTGRRERASENLTLERAKAWKPGILTSFYEKFEVVKDKDL
jgi:hypothetical protein